MEGELNVTYVTLSGYVNLHRYRYLYFTFLFTVYMLIICSNSTIVCLICTHRSLYEPMYIFIAAISVNSVLFSVLIYPKLLMDVLSAKQVISYPVCVVQGALYYSLIWSEFLLLSAMAFDRYVSICQPLRYPTIMKSRTVTFCLLSAWLLPACENSVGLALNADIKLCNFNLKGIFCNNLIYSLHCVKTPALYVFGIAALLNLGLLPLLFILFTYINIFIISYRSCSKVRRKAVQTCLPHLLVLISFSCLCAYDTALVRLEADVPKTARLVMTLQLVLYHPLFNPIIYGLKVKALSKHLKRLFCQVRSH